MDRDEKKRLRDRIGESLDVSGTRLTDDEARRLSDFLDEYDNKYRGRSRSRTTSHTGWSSDGKFIRKETFTDTFTDEPGIRQDYEYHDDDGQHGASSREVTDARGILNWLRDNP
ncbi:hypothetical protein [Nocardioides perillae]|uniref:Uncharacterized protein n=1 Tax=Nocardioides perillae TaxID=1119534 RepID=A0A7Y9ULP3_9ACTN|nr:hypothetical protein [Nocardioides perillae]NYG55287.1 hypothetical protein [Nocardioides perillae]